MGVVRLAASRSGDEKTESRSRGAGGVEPAIFEVLVDHAKRRWFARARRYAERHSVSRLNLGGPLLGQLRRLAVALARRNNSFFQTSPVMSTLRRNDPARSGLVRRRNRRECTA